MKTLLIVFGLCVLSTIGEALTDEDQRTSYGTKEGANAAIVKFYRGLGDDSAIVIDNSAFVEKTLDGLKYLAAKAYVTHTVEGQTHQEVRGFVLDETTGWMSCISEEAFNGFLSTGDRNYLTRQPNLDPNAGISQPQPQLREGPQSQPTPASSLSPAAFVELLNNASDRYDWGTITRYTADGRVDYYGRHNASNAWIRQDMLNDSHTYRSSHTTIDWSTLRAWSDGSLNYASVREWTSVTEYSGKYHHAHAVWTVGYDRDTYQIYLLELKVIN